MSGPEYNKQYREDCKRRGICKNHSGMPVVPGLYKCQICINQDKFRRRKHKRNFQCPSHPDQILRKNFRCLKCKELLRNYHKRKIENGVCPTCPIYLQVPVERGAKRCKNCLIKQRVRNLKMAGVKEEELEKAKQTLLKFKGFCECCGTSSPGSRGWHLDHCHSTKRFRGIICSSCNWMLGHAKDNPKRLQVAVRYLKIKSLTIQENCENICP